jgi:DNA repair protein RAD57
MRDFSDASLEDVHTLSTPTVHVLLNVLDKQLPTFIETISQDHARKPVKLVVIDALAELFHVTDRVTTASLVERSQKLTRISALLHQIAEHYNVAVVVLNEVVDAFDYDTTGSEKSENGLLLYSGQTKWFNRGHGVYGEDRKEASLGLVWANQVNARVMLTRTRRRRYIEEEVEGEGGKRLKVQHDEAPRSHNATSDGEPLLIRRMTVIFNSAGVPKSCDYIVTAAGVKGLVGEATPVQPHSDTLNVQPGNSRSPSTLPPVPLHQVQNPSQTVIPSSQEGEEYDHLWEGDEFYENIDWDDLEKTLSQAELAA